MKKKRTMLLAANLKKSLWPLAYLWALQLKNQAPSRSLPEVTPIQALYGGILETYVTCKFFVFMYGIHTCIYIPQEKRVKSAKMEPQSRKCQMVGYDGRGIYKVLGWNKSD